MDALLVTDLSQDWQALVVDGGTESLAGHLAALESAGYEIRFILPNGVDRWTAVARRPATNPIKDPRKGWRRWL